jgi:hypothetical protein
MIRGTLHPSVSTATLQLTADSKTHHNTRVKYFFGKSEAERRRADKLAAQQLDAQIREKKSEAERRRADKLAAQRLDAKIRRNKRAAERRRAKKSAAQAT